MTKADFYKERKESIKARYKELKSIKPKIGRETCLDIISGENDNISHATIKQILSNPKYPC